MTMKNDKRFFRGVHTSGVESFLWLTVEETYTDCWGERRADAFEERGGEMVVHDVLLSVVEDLLEV
jgi:hypothetical protein